MKHLIAILILILLSLPAFAAEPLRPSWPLTDEANPDDIWDAYESRMETIRVFSQRIPHARVEGIIKRNTDDGYDVVGRPCVFCPLGACDSEKECKDKVDELCKSAGHGGRKNSSITDNGSAGKTCMGDCSDGSGAIAFVTCKAQLLDLLRLERRGRGR